MSYEESFTISVTPPFCIDLTVWALRRRQKNLIDQWNGKKYARVFLLGGKAVRVAVEEKSKTDLLVTAKGTGKIVGMQKTITDMLKKMLGTDRSLESFYQLAETDLYVKSLVKTFKGVKPPRFPTIFEALVNAIACQQVTLDLGIILLNRLSEVYGETFADQHAFPQPKDLYLSSEKDLKDLGFSYQKARAIIGLSKALVEKELSFEDLETLSNDEVVNYLIKIRGIGRWSAEYVLLRGLGRIDTFPGDDVGAQKSLMILMNLPKRPTYDEIKKLTKSWSPYAGFVYFHLLLSKLQKKQVL